jgi:glycosyltransferase involved in cell wall biosynthesis
MRRTVLSIAYPLTPVGPDAAGGSEQILTLLDRGLVEAGHCSIVIAAAGSQVRGRLIPAPKANGRLDETARLWGQQVHRRLIQDALARFSIDLVHMHSLDFHRYLPDWPVPVLATLHLPPDWYPPAIFALRRPDFHLNCVSASQLRDCPDTPLLLPTIPNGIDLRRFGSSGRPRDFVLGLGRICPEKGFHNALEAARLARTEMVLAGEVFPYESHQEYFRTDILPRLDRRRRFIGPVGFQQKRRLLAQARCLLVPSTVAETSSLVAMEALASGTPVIAFPSGALPEIVEHGRTGFIVYDVEGMAAALPLVERLDRQTCRRVAQSRFASEEMIRRYLEAYEHILQATPPAEEHRVRPGVSWLVA